jgi:hypothetical protein
MMSCRMPIGGCQSTDGAKSPCTQPDLPNLAKDDSWDSLSNEAQRWHTTLANAEDYNTLLAWKHRNPVGTKVVARIIF